MSRFFSNLLVVASLILSSNAQAFMKSKEFESILKKKAPDWVEKETPEPPYLDEAKLEIIKKEIASDRRPAHVDKAAQSPELSTLIDELQAIKYPGDNLEKRLVAVQNLDYFLARLDKNYESYKNQDTRLFAALMVPLRTLRGMVWKGIPAFENQRGHLTHTAVLTAFKEISASLGVAMPDPNWKLGFDYVTLPYMENKEIAGTTPARINRVIADRFNNEAEFQAFLIYNIYDAVRQSRDRVRNIDVSKTLVTWDNKVAFGAKSFNDGIGRLKKIGEIEKNLLLTGLNFSLSNLAFFRAYSLNGALEIASEIGELYGFNSAIVELSGKVRSPTHEDRHNKIKKARAAWIAKNKLYNKGEAVVLGDAFESSYEKAMKVSFSRLYDGLVHLKAVWQESKSRQAGKDWLINTGFARLDHEFGDEKLDAIIAAMKGEIEIKNDLTGETARVDLKNFLNNKPPKRLFDLDANGFEKGEEKTKIATTIGEFAALNGQEVRNYFKGAATAWDVPKYKALFPRANTSEELAMSKRVFNSFFGSLSRINLINATADLPLAK